jgi:enoyl-CoA hydratase/carnithine racemase
MQAKRLPLTGDAINSVQAHSIDLGSDLVEQPEQAFSAAMAVSNDSSDFPAGGVCSTKRAFGRLSRNLAGSAFKLGFAYEMDTRSGKELRARPTEEAKR